MPNISYGSVVSTTPGTPIPISTLDPTLPANQATLFLHAILIQPLTTNVGRVYIGKKGFTKNGTGQVAWLAAPSLNSAPAFSETISFTGNAIEATEFYIDVDNPGDGVVASGVVL